MTPSPPRSLAELTVWAASHPGGAADEIKRLTDEVAALTAVVDALRERDAAVAELNRLRAMSVAEVYADRGVLLREADSFASDDERLAWVAEASREVWEPVYRRVRDAKTALASALASFSDRPDERNQT